MHKYIILLTMLCSCSHDTSASMSPFADADLSVLDGGIGSDGNSYGSGDGALQEDSSSVNCYEWLFPEPQSGIYEMLYIVDFQDCQNFGYPAAEQFVGPIYFDSFVDISVPFRDGPGGPLVSADERCGRSSATTFDCPELSLVEGSDPDYWQLFWTQKTTGVLVDNLHFEIQTMATKECVGSSCNNGKISTPYTCTWAYTITGEWIADL